VRGCCGHDKEKETSGSIKGREYLQKLSHVGI
jgi:hypothetical protein